MPKLKSLPSFIKTRKIELVILLYILIILVVGLSMQPFNQLGNGLGRIFTSPGVLVTDYMEVGGIGPALVNAALVSLIGYVIILINKVDFTGYSIAAVFTLLGFALIGKNVFSILPLIFGVYVYSRLKKEKFSNYIYQSLFCTALSPIITQTAFVFGWNLFIVFAFGSLVGVIVAPLAKQALTFHKGYNLYNTGFTSGLIGFVILSFFKGFGYNVESVLIWGSEYNQILIPLTITLFLSMIVLGFITGRGKINQGRKILASSGELVTDYVIISGFENTLINMGFVGLIGVTYIILVNGDFNGPTLGGLFTMVGFAALGKHVVNIIPIMIGVWLAANFSVNELNSPGPLLAALFGTCLAPLAGKYGPLVGILAGFVHLQLVSVTGQIHGGLNLYNNGFSAGFVAMFFVSILGDFRKHEEA